MAEKCGAKELDVILKEQALINELLCSENIVGRWRWRSGALAEKALVPWEEQAINTLVDNFRWEKNDYCVTVEAAGLYEVRPAHQVSFGLFAKKKPTGVFLVNGEPVLSLVNSNSYAIHHTSGKLKDLKGSLADPQAAPLNSSVPTGLTFIDFLLLPARARISLKFVCDVPGEGFLNLKRVS